MASVGAVKNGRSQKFNLARCIASIEAVREPLK